MSRGSRCTAPVPDAYQLPNGTLRNKLGETDHDKLTIREGQLALLRETILRNRGVEPPFDMRKLRQIHGFLFQDVYDWAGQFRTIGITKLEFEDGGSPTVFAPAAEIRQRMDDIDARLRKVDYLMGRERHHFLQAAANLFVQINNLHPFREGNGRTQRLFMESLAAAAGHPLHFSAVSKDRMIDTSIAGARGDAGPMRRLFEEISDLERVQALRKALTFLRSNPGNYGDNYLATTVAGQTYEGRLVGRAGKDFMLRVDKPKRMIVIGHIQDLASDVESDDEVTLTPRRF